MIKSYKGGVHVINKQKILIVDDSLMICQRVKSVLSVLPATIYDVHTGKDLSLIHIYMINCKMIKLKENKRML